MRLFSSPSALRHAIFMSILTEPVAWHGMCKSHSSDLPEHFGIFLGNLNFDMEICDMTLLNCTNFGWNSCRNSFSNELHVINCNWDKLKFNFTMWQSCNSKLRFQIHFQLIFHVRMFYMKCVTLHDAHELSLACIMHITNTWIFTRY